MNLEQQIAGILGPGRAAKPALVLDAREATAEDLEALRTRKAVEPEPLKRITQRHHQVARLLAAGMGPGEIGAITGYTPSRLSVLQNSPAMRDLIQLYRKEVDAEFSQVFTQMRNLSADALGELQDRLETDPDDFSANQLMALAELALDRTGHPRVKEHKSEVTVNLGDRLDAARERARQAALGTVADAEVPDGEPT